MQLYFEIFDFNLTMQEGICSQAEAVCSEAKDWAHDFRPQADSRTSPSNPVSDKPTALVLPDLTHSPVLGIIVTFLVQHVALGNS